jgi:Spy/CpxP family protein refolding chaperone
MGISTVDNRAGHGREHHTARNGRHEQTTTNLGMSTESSQAKREDGSEARRLEAKHEYEHRDRRSSRSVHGRNDKDEAEAEIQGEYVAGFERRDHQQEPGEKTVECVQALASGQEISCDIISKHNHDKCPGRDQHDSALVRPASIQKLMK